MRLQPPSIQHVPCRATQPPQPLDDGSVSDGVRRTEESNKDVNPNRCRVCSGMGKAGLVADNMPAHTASMKRPLVTAVVALLAGPVFATNWVQVSESPELTASVNTDSIRRMGDIAQAWTKFVMKNDHPEQLGFVLRQMAYSCSARSAGVMTIVAYKPDGTVLDEKKVAQVVFVDAPPDTVEDMLTTYVCANRK
jgi:hypothetical protein